MWNMDMTLLEGLCSLVRLWTTETLPAVTEHKIDLGRRKHFPCVGAPDDRSSETSHLTIHRA